MRDGQRKGSQSTASMYISDNNIVNVADLPKHIVKEVLSDEHTGSPQGQRRKEGKKSTGKAGKRKKQRADADAEDDRSEEEKDMEKLVMRICRPAQSFAPPLLLRQPAQKEDAAGPKAPPGRPVGGDDPDGAQFMRWLLHPSKLDHFMKNVYESRAMVIEREDASYFDGWLSIDDVRRNVMDTPMRYGEQIDVVKVDDRGRKLRRNYNGDEHHRIDDDDDSAGLENEAEVIDGAEVWARFRDDGYSLRLLHPQRWMGKLQTMLRSLESFWQTPAGAFFVAL